MLSLPYCRILVLWAALLGLSSSNSEAQSGTKPRSGAPATRTRPTAPRKDAEIQPTSGAERPQRPAPQEYRIEPLPPELEKLLLEWERVSSDFERLSGTHERIIYNKVFEVEKYSKGLFYYEAPDKGRIDLEPYPVKKNQPPLRSNPKTGNPYRVEADKPTKWICTGKEVLTIDEEEKTVEAFPLPPELHGKNIIHGPLPFLFGMKAEDAKRRFELSHKVDSKDPSIVWITAMPRQVTDKENFKEAKIKLDRKRFVPIAVKLLDPSENIETVYSFKKIDINKPQLVPEIFRNDPFHPSLKNYKMILPPEAAQVDPKSRPRDGEPAGRASTIRQTGGTSSSGSARPPRTANADSSGGVAPRAKSTRTGK